jgi:hypothetical protein
LTNRICRLAVYPPKVYKKQLSIHQEEVQLNDLAFSSLGKILRFGERTVSMPHQCTMSCVYF